MNPAQFHLAINHFPIFATLFGVAIFAGGILRHQAAFRQLGLTLMVFAGVTTIPVFLSGEPAEELIEDMPGVSESYIHPHEEAGEAALILGSLLGVLAAALLLLERMGKILPVWANPVVILYALIVLGAFLRTAHLGGEIRHPELRAPGAATTAPADKGHAEEAEGHE